MRVTRLTNPAEVTRRFAAEVAVDDGPAAAGGALLDLILDDDAPLPAGWEDNGDGTATLRDVELTAVGRWLSMGGEATVDDTDLDDAIAAEADPEVPAAPIRLGHVDPRFDGEPALGWVGNLKRGADNAGVLVGDLLAVPRRLAALVHTLYRRRSVGLTDAFETPAGKQYKTRLHHLALLGSTDPAVPGLADAVPVQLAGDPAGLRVLLAEQSLTEQEQEVRDAWRRHRRTVVGDEVDTWAVEVYPSEVIVEENGQHYRVGYTRGADGAVTFATSASRVERRWVDEDGTALDTTTAPAASTATSTTAMPAAALFAAGGNGSPASATGGSNLPANAAAAPGSPITPSPRSTPAMANVDEATLRELRTIADDDAFNARVAELIAADAGGDGDDADGAEGGAGTSTDTPAKPGETQSPSDGTVAPPVTQPAGELVQLSAGDVATMQAAAKELREDKVTRLLSAAMTDNRIAVAEQETWRAGLLSDNPAVVEHTEKLLAARPKGSGGMPTTLLGAPTGGDVVDTAVHEADLAAFGD